jgi:hypothetical protein
MQGSGDGKDGTDAILNMSIGLFPLSGIRFLLLAEFCLVCGEDFSLI